MQVLATINDPMKFPDADHVVKDADGYTVYGPAKDGKHKAIAILKDAPDGKFVVVAATDVVNKLTDKTTLSEAETKAAYPINRTLVEVITPGRPNRVAQDIGPPPKGDTLHGRKVLSTEPAPEWTLQRMLDREYQIAAPDEDLLEEKIIH